jgi:lipopolysaccharide export LptBFGC system permease protein LptF
MPELSKLKTKITSTKQIINQAKSHNCYNALLYDGFLSEIIMKTYKDVYQLPLEENHGWIYDQKNNFVFQFMIDDEKTEQKILDVINGKENFKNLDLVFKHEQGQIVDKSGLPIILIRGWGNLTGTGAMNLSVEEASNIQDTFADFIVERLNYRDSSEAII